MAQTEWRAWYSPKNADGTWDLSLATRLVVLHWASVTVSGDAGEVDEFHGLVRNPADIGVTGALVAADSVVIPGYDGRPQYFVTYVEQDDDAACAEFETLLT